MMAQILVAGIGNIFFGDDAFGCEVARRLSQRNLPGHVRVVDFGIRGFDLTYALMDDYQAIILVDAVPRGEAPGTLYTMELDLDSIDPAGTNQMMVETHGMNPMRVLAMVKAMGGRPKRLLLVGCEPATGVEEESMGLSEPVQTAVDEAVGMVVTLLLKLTKENDHEQRECSESDSDFPGGGGGDCIAAGHQTVHKNEHDVG
jgi:hydrogenase maturation protease